METTKTAIQDRYEALVRTMGRGFHPDTSADGYDRLPEGITADDYNAIIDDAEAEGIDVYDVALAVMEESDA
jgi:hypothetical protein